LALAVWRSRYGKPTHQVVTLTAADLSAMKAHLTAEGGSSGGPSGEMVAGEFLSTNDVIVRSPPAPRSRSAIHPAPRRMRYCLMQQQY
jgi:hypothetical protein